jgi:ubiquinone/menaquinone biosynthesis C-methylase UbiE
METFKEYELAGWDSKAGNYADYAGRVTSQMAGRLLDATGAARGKRLLDVACGPGYVTAMALQRGASVIAVDFAPSMVAVAKKRVPGADIRQGDAEALAFDANTFDAVVCSFGIGHMPEPDKAFAEAYRVLRPGGRYAFTWWAEPGRHEFFGLVYDSVKAHGNPDVPLPLSPPITRFSDLKEAQRSLAAVGFTDTRASEHPLVYEIGSPREAVDLITKSGVRMAMLLDAQAAAAREKIERAIAEGVEKKHKVAGGYRIGWLAVLASGRKP